MTAVLRTLDLGKRYGTKWALRHCTLEVTEGQVVALVGPNGAGKSTLLELATGLNRPSEGTVELMGRSPLDALPDVGFVAQDHPLYRSFSVAEMVKFGHVTNVRFDDEFAHQRLRTLGIPTAKRVGQLSGGQQAQVALVLAMAKRPKLLLLDEPIAAFDPLARREFLQLLMETVAASGCTVVLSSHILGDLERVCDAAVVLSASELQLTGSIEAILENHRFVVGPADEELLTHLQTVIHVRRSARQVAALVRLDAPLVLSDGWAVHEPSLEDVVLAYLEYGRTTEMEEAA